MEHTESLEERLPEFDRDFLTERGFAFEVLEGDGSLHLILKDFPFPPAYDPQTADVLIQIPAGYPNAKLDMIWTSPPLRLVAGGTPLRCEHEKTYHGRVWQRWSRHLPESWRVGVDSVKTFLAAMRREIDKGI